MFPWNIAQVFLKKAFKFVLKKKLGHLILGDIDLQQLDLQLSKGILNLSDLALNTDYLNQQLIVAGSVIRVREGSIRSLSIKFPWNAYANLNTDANSCQIEVDELELVLSPFPHHSDHHPTSDYKANPASDAHIDKDTSSSATGPLNLHKGVKTVANLVQHLLTSFHITIRNVIIAFDTSGRKDDAPHHTLVLRLTQIECGTCMADPSSDTPDPHDLLGMSHLINFLKFQGAALDLLHINTDFDPSAPDSTPSNASKPLLIGHNGGFSGSVNLSIPWKNGSLDIRKLNAEVRLDPIIAKLQPSTLNWILATWDMLQNFDDNKVDSVYDLAVDALVPSAMMSDKSAKTDYPMEFGSPRETTISDVLLKESQLISDWIPVSNGNCQVNECEEADLGSSIDQFFECFDEMRSSHSVLGSSGVLSWTCSVFSAITAASNLASGSLNVSADQQHVHTNLKVTLAGVSAIVSFLDDEDPCFKTDSSVHHLGLILGNSVIAVQVHPLEWKLEATVTSIVLNDYFSQEGGCVELGLHDHDGVHNGQSRTIRGMQDRIQSALPFSCLFGEESGVKHSGASNNLEVLSSLMDPESGGCGCDIVTVTLCETTGDCHCLFSANSRSSDGRSSLSLKLPPFIFWLSFDVVNMILEFFRKFEEFPGKSSTRTKFSSKGFQEKRESSAHWSPDCQTMPTISRGSLVGSLFLPHARIILCFPCSKARDLKSYASWNQFIALDFSSMPNLKNSNSEEPSFVPENTYWKQITLSPTCSVHLNVAKLDVYHVTSGADGDDGSDVRLESQRLDTHRVLSFGNGSEWVRLVTMFWNENAVTGDEIMKSAKLYATSHGPFHSMPSTKYESASISSLEHVENNFSLKQKLLLSSKLSIHVCVPSMVVKLSRSQYLCFFDLLNEVKNALADFGDEADRDFQDEQVSIIVECGMVEIILDLGHEDCLESSMQRQLPGSWDSFKFEVRKLELLYVSNIGSVCGAHFLWISHCEGMLWGTISSLANYYFRLISCNNASNGRGDGEGSNVLSCRPAGSDFVYLSDRESSHDFLSIILKCSTIIAPGGRLDWLDKISSFFSLASPEFGEGAEHNLQKGDSQKVSFLLKLLDGGLSYEPYLEKPKINDEVFGSTSHVFVRFDENLCDQYIACLLAASSLTVSNTKLAESCDNDYSIRFQDVGLLLHEVSKSENVLAEYSATCLQEIGYVKVAGVAVVDAILSINYNDYITWELCCSESHIVLRTCHDSISGLIRLASQLQQLFAPEMEESLKHFQNKWNCFQQAQGKDDFRGVSTSSACGQVMSLSDGLVLDSKPKSELVGLMGEICEDAFLQSGKGVEFCDHLQPIADYRNGEGSSSAVSSSQKFLNVVHTSVPENADIMEGYCLSDLKSLSELTITGQSGEELSNSYMASNGISGWYGRTPLRIVEDYVADNTDPYISKCFVEGQQCKKECSGSIRYKGRVDLKNIEVKWQMYAGSDWCRFGQSGNTCGRDGSVCLELMLCNMNIQYDIFPDRDRCASKLCVSVQDLHLSDQSRNAPWKLVLGYYNSKEHPRESLSKALKLELEAVRPDPLTPLEEYRLQLAVLPLLLHLHQSQLDFLVAFFGGDCSLVEQQDNLRDSSHSDVCFVRDNKLKGSGISEEALLPFFQKLDIWPIVVKVDYRPNRVDLGALSEGKFVELVNLVPWKGIELQLKHVQASGVYGWSNVCETAIGEWLEDISHNQIHKLLQGLPTIRSFVSVGSGAAKLLSLPVKNYRKDYRLVKGLQRGTISFLRSISVEALGLGVHLAAGAHDILLHAECILARIQPSVHQPTKGNLKANLGSEQPQDAQHGLQQAYERLSDGFGKSAATLICAPMKTYQRDGSAGSALVTAVRGAPAAAIAPASAAAQALHCALVGARNSLEPERKEESMKKYLGAIEA